MWMHNWGWPELRGYQGCNSKSPFCRELDRQTLALAIRRWDVLRIFVPFEFICAQCYVYLHTMAISETCRIHTLKCSAAYISESQFFALTILYYVLDIILWWFSRSECRWFLCVWSSIFSHSTPPADQLRRFQWHMLPPARFKRVGWSALDFKPPHCFKTLQLCWDIRWFLVLKWAVKSTSYTFLH